MTKRGDSTSAVAKPRRLTRQEALGQTRSRLLEAAWELFREQGYADTTLDHVAERAGLTRTPIYSHFGDKEGLFYALWLDKSWPVKLPSDGTELGTPLRSFLEAADTHRANRLIDPDMRLRVELSLIMLGLLVRHDRLRASFELELQNIISSAASDLARYADASGEELPLPADKLAVLFTASNLGLMQLSLWPSLGVDQRDFRYAQLTLLQGLDGQ